MFAGREFDGRERAEEVGVAAFGAHAGVDILFGDAREAERRGDVAVGHGGSFFRPDVGGRFPVLAEFDADLTLGDRGPVDLRRLADDFRGLGGLGAAGAVVAGVGAGADLGDVGLGDGRQGGGEACGDFSRGDEGTIEADVIDRAAEAAIGEAAHGGADPHRGVVDHGRIGRLTVHVPGTFDLLAVDPAADALGFAEFVTHRDVVPATVVGEAGGSGPAMPLDTGAGRRSEEEVEAGAVVEHAQAQSPVLVARVGGLRVGATLTDDIGVLAFAKTVGLHPSFEGDRVAVLEVEEAICARVLDFEVRAFAVEGRGFILLLKARVVRPTGARLFEGDGADGVELWKGGAVEIPHRHGLG